MIKSRVSILAMIALLLMTSFAGMNLTASGTPSLTESNVGTGKDQQGPSDDQDGEGTAPPVQPQDLEIDADTSYFIRNDGQWDSSLSFIGTTDQGSIGFSTDGVYINLVENVDSNDGSVSGHVLMLKFEDARPVQPEGLEPLEGKFNYMIGSQRNWVVGVPTFYGVAYRDLWNGIDLIYSYKDGSIKYDFVLKPGANPSDIRIRVEGGDSLGLKDGNLVINVKNGLTFVDSNLKLWYNDRTIEPITGRVMLLGSDMYTFDLENYDAARGAVIDPLYYSTFLGGYPTTYGYDIAVDSYGCA